MEEGDENAVETTELTIEEFLIELVRSKPFLYNVKDPGYKDTVRKDNAWEEIANLLQWTPQETKKFWELKRDGFLRYHRMRTQSKSGQGAKAVGRPWPLYDQMLWYLDFCHLRTSTISNMNKKRTSGPPQVIVHGEQPSTQNVKAPEDLPSLSADVVQLLPDPSVQLASSEVVPEMTATKPRPPLIEVPRIVPPSDIKKRKRVGQTDIASSLLHVSGMSDAVKSLAEKGKTSQDTQDPAVEGFKIVAGLEYAKVPLEKRTACQLAVLQVISTFHST